MFKHIPITKAKTLVEIDTDKVPDDVYSEALTIGLTELANRGMSRISIKDSKCAELALTQANANVKAIYASKIIFRGRKYRRT